MRLRQAGHGVILSSVVICSGVGVCLCYGGFRRRKRNDMERPSRSDHVISLRNVPNLRACCRTDSR